MNAELHVKPVRQQILEYLKGKPPQTVGDIAKALQKESTNVHRIVNDLTDNGLIFGEAGPNRATVYSLDTNEDDTLSGDFPDSDPSALPRHDPTNPGRVVAPLSITPRAAAPMPTAPAPLPAAEPDPAPEPARRQRRTRVSSADFMKLFADLSSDSEKLQRIRSILEE